MNWDCPKCKRKTLVIIDATFKESSKYYCKVCAEYFDFDEFLEANEHRMEKVKK